MSEYSEAPIHPYAGVSGALWPTGVPQADRQPALHRQTRRIPWRYAATG